METKRNKLLNQQFNAKQAATGIFKNRINRIYKHLIKFFKRTLHNSNSL